MWKLNNFNDAVLARIHDMGFTHIWYTGVIRHATQTDYSSFGIPVQHAEVVKGKAGSPYAIPTIMTSILIWQRMSA